MFSYYQKLGETPHGNSKELTPKVKQTFQDAARKLKGGARRQYMAQITLDYFNGSPTKAERFFGWGRNTIRKGLGEIQSGFTCVDNYSAWGRKRTEETHPDLITAILHLVEPSCQADPHLKSSFAYTRITAKAVRDLLLNKKGYSEAALPCENTIGTILNRLGFRLGRVQKTKPIRKIEQTDAIFDNVHRLNEESDGDPTKLRLSIDTKAKVSIGCFSRGGKIRSKNPVTAFDHDFQPTHSLIPFGILDVKSDQLMIVFGSTLETSDFIVDGLICWWEKNRTHLDTIEELIINLDNGPHCHSRRSQFIYRMLQFADRTQKRIRLVYYPPYHSKYNRIERCWGILETHWNGMILDTREKALNCVKTMTWKGKHPEVEYTDHVYTKGKKWDQATMQEFETALQRSETLPKWDVIIEPISA